MQVEANLLFRLTTFFFRTEHVVKLIGMVTKSQPVFVLMEFMGNGDLQNFLRKRRQGIRFLSFVIFSDAPASLALMIVCHSLIETADWQSLMFDSYFTTRLVHSRL